MKQSATARISGDETIQAALQMEQLGKDFYEALGDACTDREVRDLCRKLVSEEAEHLKTFQGIRSELARQARTVLLTDHQASEMRRLIRREVIPGMERIREVVSAGKVHDLLAIAIEMENDAIRFYSEMIRHFPGKTVIQAIIKEEEKHVRDLHSLL